MTFKKIIAASIISALTIGGGIAEVKNTASASQDDPFAEQIQRVSINANASVPLTNLFHLDGNLTKLNISISLLEDIALPVDVTIEKREANSWTEVENYTQNVDQNTSETPHEVSNLAPGTYRLKIKKQW